MRVGNKWGWLTCLEIVGGWAEDGGGAVQEWVKEKEYRLQCRCGREVVVQASEFKEKGKNGMRSCGLNGCEALGVGVGVGVGTGPTPGRPVESTVPTTAAASMGEGVASMGQTTPPVPTPHATPPPVPPPYTRLGRPPKYGSRAAVANFYLPVELVGWMRGAADAQGKSASQFVTELLERERGQGVGTMRETGKEQGL